MKMICHIQIYLIQTVQNNKMKEEEIKKKKKKIKKKKKKTKKGGGGGPPPPPPPCSYGLLVIRGGLVALNDSVGLIVIVIRSARSGCSTKISSSSFRAFVFSSIGLFSFPVSFPLLLTPILYRISFIMSRLFLKKNLYF